MKGKLTLLISGLALVALLVSCQNPAEQSTVTKGPTLLYSDDFKGKSPWLESSDTRRAFSYYSGLYQISASSPGTWWWATCPYTDQSPLSGAYSIEFEAVFSVIDPAANGSFGLVFHYLDDSNYDRLSFDKNGQYSMNRISAGVIPSPPTLDWSNCPAFVVGESNKIQVSVTATSLELFVNGNKVTSSSQFTPPSNPSKAGLMVDNFGVSTSKANFTSFRINRL